MTKQGVLPDTGIEALVTSGAITKGEDWRRTQIQPASLDLTLGRRAWRLRASFLPNGRTVADCLGGDLVLHAIDLSSGAVLETGCVYLIELGERFALPDDLSALANPKSSTGRIDVFVRLICDGAQCFDAIPQGYCGPLYAEVSPRTFTVLAHPGEALLQARFRRGERVADKETVFSVDLSAPKGVPVGFRARRHAGILDLKRIGQHPPELFWEPVFAREGRIVLDPGEFYILASAESVSIGLDEAAEMAAIAPEFGEFRAHYAGFFDPGFGLNAGGSRAVLEVRSRDVPFILEHGQRVGKLVHEAMSAPPAKPYGDQGSHYQGQGLKLSKHFGPWTT
jgi:dCTP deaminase